jgi:uncharacterized protein YgiM (DUF1202 family)
MLVMLALAGPAVGAPPAAPVASSPAGVEPMPVATYVARQARVPIRTDPGFVYREIRVLALGDEVEVDGRVGEWMRVRGGGWLLADHVWTPAEAAAAPPEPTTLVVVRDGARIRESPRTDAAIINTLDADATVEAVLQQDGWWQLATGGWINSAVVRPRAASPSGAGAAAQSSPSRATGWVVAAETANVRSSRGTGSDVVKRLVRGDVVAVTGVIDGWAQVQGGWVREDLLQAPAPRGSGSGDGTSTSARPRARRWTLMNLNGTIFEVYELVDPGLIQAIRGEMKATRMLEADWTYLGLTIGVPRDSAYLFRYSPDRNKVVVTGAHGQKYGNVFARGPIQKMPTHVRSLLEGREINPGERFDGVLMFRPTLKVEDIVGISIEIQGREQKFVLTP